MAPTCAILQHVGSIDLTNDPCPLVLENGAAPCHQCPKVKNLRALVKASYKHRHPMGRYGCRPIPDAELERQADKVLAAWRARPDTFNRWLPKETVTIALAGGREAYLALMQREVSEYVGYPVTPTELRDVYGINP